MKLGIVGLPNVGKSTLFNAITNAGAQSANFPFCTIDPNVGVVAVPDTRLNALCEMYTEDSKVPPIVPAEAVKNTRNVAAATKTSKKAPAIWQGPFYAKSNEMTAVSEVSPQLVTGISINASNG